MKNKRTGFQLIKPVCWALVIGAALCGPVQGEIKHNADGQDPLPSAALEEITVTAQKQTENEKDVPISMKVINGQSIDDMQIKSVMDIGARTPNLMMFENGVSGMISPSFRGITSDIEARAVPSGMYIDGVPVLAGIGFDEPLMNIERVEVLRGPQGTLYGKNTEAGVINVITRQPGNDAHIKGAMEFGEDGKREYAMTVNTPIVKDRFFLGFSGRHYEKDGYVKHSETGKTVDNRENNYGKLVLRYTPSSDLDISFINSMLKYDDGGASMNYANMPGRKVSSGLDGYNKSRSFMSVVKVKYDCGPDTGMESITSLRDYDVDTRQDWDFSPAVGYHVDRKGNNKTLAQELRFHSRINDKFKYTTGLYLEKNDDELWVGTNYYTISTDFKNKALGLFGHATYQATEDLALIGGLRYDKETKEIEDKARNIDESESFDALSPKIAVQYKILPDIMTWASASKGYRSGGFSTFIVEGKAHPFDEEQLWSYEIGMKNSLFNNRLSINASLYYMDIDDMQVQQPLGPEMEITTNAAKAASKGIELELNARVTDTLGVFAGAGYNDIKFDSFSDVNGDYEGNRVPFAPKYNFNVGGQYRNLSGIYGRMEVAGYGDMYFDKENRYKRDAYTLVNAKLGYETDYLDCYLYAKNLFDKTYDSDGYYNGFYTIYSPPREIGIQVVLRF
ncbi:MAG: TonB-dependent receptor [Desulfobacteraceae bacterium]|nr:TonB-dependent receptor [Desulfobacteraceae bacterium]